MAQTVEAKMTGLDALIAKMDAISVEMRFKGGRFGLRKAANLIAEAARQGAAKMDDAETGRSIAKNVAVRFSSRTAKATGDIKFRIGVLHGAQIPKENDDKGAGGPTPHWRLLEFGTEKMRAQPFMRPAIENNVQAAVDTFAREAEKSIDRAIRKAQKGK